MHADQAKSEATDFFAAGDYSFWSRILEPASQSLVEAARVGAGGRVLDVAAGDEHSACRLQTWRDRDRHLLAINPVDSGIHRGRLLAPAPRRCKNTGRAAPIVPRLVTATGPNPLPR